MPLEDRFEARVEVLKCKQEDELEDASIYGVYNFELAKKNPKENLKNLINNLIDEVNGYEGVKLDSIDDLSHIEHEDKRGEYYIPWFSTNKRRSNSYFIGIELKRVVEHPASIDEL